MIQSYRPEEKRRIDAILEAFSDFITSLQDIDILYSPKMGLYVIIYPQFDDEELDAHALYRVDDVLFELFVLLTTNAETVRRELGPEMCAKELEECQRRIAPILARLQGDDRVYCETAWAEFLSDMESADAFDHLLYDAFQPLSEGYLNDNPPSLPQPPTRVRYTGESCVSLTNGKEYEVLAVESGWYRIVDDTEEDYLFDPVDFEVIE